VEEIRRLEEYLADNVSAAFDAIAQKADQKPANRSTAETTVL
jgi:hypothetical protein